MLTHQSNRFQGPLVGESGYFVRVEPRDDNRAVIRARCKVLTSPVEAYFVYCSGVRGEVLHCIAVEVEYVHGTVVGAESHHLV